MRELGWVRVDPRPWKKTSALWKHRRGWSLVHCGHPTANWPYALVMPDRTIVCQGVRRGKPVNFGYAWARLEDAAEWLDMHLRSGRALTPPSGAPHVWEGPL